MTGESKRGSTGHASTAVVEGQPYAPAYDADQRDQLGYEVTPQGFSHPCWVEEDRTLLDVLYTADGFTVILFDPVPQQRKRRVGWDEARQRGFVDLLARTPSISFAARTVGMSPQSVYRLLEKPGAEQFAKAIDIAIDHGLMQLRMASTLRGLGEDAVPVFRRGRHVRTELRHNDRLAMTILRQAVGDPDRLRHAAQLRWRNKQEWAALDAGQAADKAKAAARAEGYDRELAEMMAAGRPLRNPQVRQL